MTGSMNTQRKDGANWANGRDISNDERGATIIEYAILLSLVALAILASLNLVGTATNGLFSRLAAELQAPESSGTSTSGTATAASGTAVTSGTSGTSGTAATSGTSTGSNHHHDDD
jgi:Flp pilus assembly pilin Flp